MTHQAIARDLLAALCCLQGLATLAIDLNRTHATNPAWPGHARFHVVWQTASIAILAVLQVVLLLAGGPFEQQRFYLAAILTGVPMLGFFTALVARRLYGGTLSDPNGIPPVTITLSGSQLPIDLNLAAVVAGVIVLGGLVLFYRHV